jgi:outer membrane protein OmpA-like peptidoglycan-associated protein
MRKVIFFMLLMMTAAVTYGQTYKSKLDSIWTVHQIKRGEHLYNNMHYLQATKIYSPVFKKNKLTERDKSILAQSYINIASDKNALEVLQSMDTSKLAPADVYNMVKALKLNGLYDESDMWMNRYKKLQSNDTRTKWQVNNADEIKRLEIKNRYNIECLPFNSPQSDFGACEEGHNIVFASARKVDEIMAREYGWKETPYLNVFVVNDSSGVYSSPKIFSQRLKTVYHDGPVCFSADGKEIYVTQNPYKFPGTAGKKKVNYFRLYVARKDANGSWGELESLPFNGNDFSTGHAALSADGKRLWFASDRPGGMGKSDIYYVERNGDSWGDPVNAGPDINTEGDEMFPFEANDGTLYFSSDGHLTLGGLDICIAFKTKNGYKIRNMGCPVNSASDDFSLFLMADNKNGYFASNRPNGYGDDDIYKLEIVDPVVFSRTVEVKVLDGKTLKPIAGSEIKVQSGNELMSLKTDDTGLASVTVEEENDQVNITADAVGYQSKTTAINITGDVSYADILLSQMPVWGLLGKITDMATGLPVDSIQVVIQPLDKPSSICNMTSDGGTFRNELSPETDYSVTLSNPKYFTKRGIFTTKGRNPGWIDINEFMQANIEKIEVNKVIEIPNIYYDLGKWNIRKDAAIELDKVVEFMKDNPSIVIELGSHTDSRGSATYNQSLSQKRAQSAVDYIVKKGGVEQSRISAKGYGESMLKNNCADGVKCTEEEHQQNRRTEIRIVGFN